ncbi:alpha-ketoglutarate-dependent dioxygenase AlkB [SAR86 cluster bacterium]|nr:alpha-ketoglutarate-dependent dioxygenase AlkB [Gammaproteobacteria bacterium]URQ72647.1 alpha-ketoglutarate-dependent dioxygenase AlkB [SAR86 cluster bacterium]|tara:strand:- start:1410 stop:2003 length:594 start_codon:yes stop_codon:yes gene_type:complete
MKQEIINHQNLDIILDKFFLNQSDANNLYDRCLNDISWQSSAIIMFGKKIDVPRLECWYGDLGCEYTYSGKSLKRFEFPNFLLNLRMLIEKKVNSNFNSVLANLYRDGQDSMGLHADDEKELGNEPVIASISLGENRPIIFQNKKTKEKVTFDQPHGSLLVMQGKTQDHWKHAINKSKKIDKPRINLTFRNIITTEL